MGSKSFKIGLYPFLYLVFFLIFQYSINDMATSTNAYQAQGNRLMVYVYLVAILVVLGVYFFSIRTIRMIIPIKMVILMTIWVTIDNFFLGNFFNGSMWTCFTHIGLSVWWIPVSYTHLMFSSIRNTVACGFPFNKKGGWG